MSPAEPTRFIEVSGDRRSMGLAHGEQLREPIQRCIEIYRTVFAMPEHALRMATRRHEQRIRHFAPGAATEMASIAEGAAVDPDWIIALNARSELLAGQRDGCTAVFVPQHALLGQTWDWLDALEPLATVIVAEPDDCAPFVTLTEPGIIAKIGLNANGIGVCLNYMFAATNHPGIPIHVLLAELLRCGTLDDVDRLIERAGPGRAGNIIVGTSSAEGRCLEYIGDRYSIGRLTDRFVHTNHVEDEPATGGPLIDNSQARLQRARHLVGTVKDSSSLAALLADRSDRSAPINSPYIPYAGARIGTAATVIMDLEARRLDATSGPDQHAIASVSLT